MSDTCWMTAKMAVDFGIVDSVWTKQQEVDSEPTPQPFSTPC